MKGVYVSEIQMPMWGNGACPASLCSGPKEVNANFNIDFITEL
jgi:hypothetical protein